MTVLDATADAILCRPHSPLLGAPSALDPNSTDTLEIYVNYDQLSPVTTHGAGVVPFGEASQQVSVINM